MTSHEHPTDLPWPFTRYRACRSIRAGDHICFSYIDAIWTKSTIERRRDCNETKDFSCRCVRCVGPDTTRVFRCPREGCDGFATPEVKRGSEVGRERGGRRGMDCGMWEGVGLVTGWSISIDDR